MASMFAGHETPTWPLSTTRVDQQRSELVGIELAGEWADRGGRGQEGDPVGVDTINSPEPCSTGRTANESGLIPQMLG